MSLDIETFLSSLLSIASDWFNGLLPIFAIVVGISLGLGLLYLIVRAIKNALPGV